MNHTKTMTTQEVANRLVALVREGKNHEAEEELLADDVKNIEPAHAPFKSVTGKAALLKKSTDFYAILETRHSSTCSDPLVYGNHFSVGMTLDATLKGLGRIMIEEICVYEVKDGKIVTEQFFF